MAKIIPGAIGQLSGSIGDTTYSRNRYGLYARRRGIPVNPNSARQNAVRTIFSDLAQHWQNTLTAAQRSAWETYGANVTMIDKLGQAITLTGQSHYIRSNVAALTAGLTRVDDGPTTFTLPGEDPTLTVTADSATGELSVAFDDSLDWLDETGGALLIHAGRSVAPTINFYRAPFRFADSVDGDDTTPPTTPATITAPFTLSSGNVVHVYARILRADGRLSSPFRTSASIS